MTKRTKIHHDENGEFRPIPDPTVRTTEQIERFESQARDYVDGQIGILKERFNAIDKATELLSDTVNQVPTETQKEVAHLAGILNVEMESIAKQFAERDTRSEREARDNKLAVDAAFAAQEKQAVAESESNQKAIDKSEVATNKAIDKLAELFGTNFEAMTDKVDDLRSRVQSVENSRNTSIENRQENRADSGALTAVKANSINIGYAIASTFIGTFVVMGAIFGIAKALGA